MRRISFVVLFPHKEVSMKRPSAVWSTVASAVVATVVVHASGRPTQLSPTKSSTKASPPRLLKELRGKSDPLKVPPDARRDATAGVFI